MERTSENIVEPNAVAVGRDEMLFLADSCQEALVAVDWPSGITHAADGNGWIAGQRSGAAFCFSSAGDLNALDIAVLLHAKIVSALSSSCWAKRETMIERPEVGMWAGVSSLGAIADDGRYLDELGFRSIWTGEQQESMIAAGLLSAVVRRADIGTAITQITRPPALMALGATTMQVLTDNRFRLGLGLGGVGVERWMGIPLARRSQRFVEYVRALRACLAASRGAPVSFEGEFYQVRGYGAMVEHTAPPPPIWVAASGPMMLKAAGAVGDGVLLINLFPPSYFRDHARALVERGAREAGRDPAEVKVGFTRYAAVDPDRSTARERMRATIARSALSDYHQRVLGLAGFGEEAAGIKAAAERGDAAAGRAAVSDDLIDAVAIVGTSDDIRRQIAAYGDYGDMILLHTANAGLSPAEGDAHNRRLAEAVAG
ncbi:MAG: LLM class flavin-dependent oxidoreductase [Dehalococcoidia bacterium]